MIILKREKLEEEKKLKEIEKKAKEAERKILDEPQEGNPDVTTICFRYPDGEKIKNRRFLKSNKIQNLYDYVTSLGSDIYSEEGNSSFSLYQPFPPKKYSNIFFKKIYVIPLYEHLLIKHVNNYFYFMFNLFNF